MAPSVKWSQWILQAPNVYPAGIGYVPPPQPCEDFATGFTFIDPSGESHTLGLAVEVQSTIGWSGGNCPTPNGGTVANFNSYGGDGEYTAFVLPADQAIWKSNMQAWNVTLQANNPQINGSIGPFTVMDSAGTQYHFATTSCNAGAAQPCQTGVSSIEDRNGNIIPLSLTNTPGTGTYFSGGARYVLSNTFKLPPGPASSYPSFTLPTQRALSQEMQQYPPDRFSLPIFNFTVNGSLGWTDTFALPTGQKYALHYGTDSLDPTLQNTYNLLNQIVYPQGGWVKYTWMMSSGYTARASFSAATAQVTTYPVIKTVIVGTEPDNWFELDSTAEAFSPGPTYYNASIVRYNVPVLASRQVSYDGKTVAQTQTFSYTTNWPASWTSNPDDWISKSTTVTTTDNTAIASNNTYVTVYNYVPSSLPNPPLAGASLPTQLPVESTIQYYDWGPANGTPGALLKTISKTWYNPQQLASQQTSYPSGQTDKTTYLYASGNTCAAGSAIATFPSLLCEQDDYDFGQSNPLRKTLTSYTGWFGQGFPPAGPSDVIVPPQPSKVVVQDGSGNSLSESDFFYDQSGLQSAGLVANQDPGYSGVTARANLTTITKKCLTPAAGGCNADAATQYVYDTTGQPAYSIDPNGNQTAYSFKDCFTDAPSSATSTNIYLTQITRPSTNGASHVSNYCYAAASGQVASVKDENQQTTTYSYADPLYRLTDIFGPSSAGSPHTQYKYVDGTASSQTKVDPMGVTTKELLDGMGHTVQTQLISDPLGTDYVDTVYNGMGWLGSISNPYRAANTTTNGTTSYAYDALGRKTNAQMPDGATQRWSYNGNVSTFTNEQQFSWRRTTDALGRLTQVFEPSPNGSSSLETDYQYDGLDNLASVHQLGTGGETARHRSFSYDSLARLTCASNPEDSAAACVSQSAPSTPPTPTPAPPAPAPPAPAPPDPAPPVPDPPPSPPGECGDRICAYPNTLGTTANAATSSTTSRNTTYSYDLNGNLVAKTDARGQITSYTYDALNRITSKSLNGSLAAGYYYDGSVGSGAPVALLGSTPNNVGRLSFTRTYFDPAYGLTGVLPYDDQYFGYDSVGRLKHWMASPPSEWGYGQHSIDAGYDLAGNVTALTYPDGRSVTQNFDGAGRLSSVFGGTSTSSGPAYVSSISYLASGSPNVITYGNGVTETLTQNNRLQPCESVVAGGGQPFIHRQYFYGTDNTPGQQCAPASGNNGNIQNIGDAINAPHSQSFSYDTLNRITSWDTSSFAGTARHQSFNYDSFGNVSQTNKYPPPAGTTDPLTFPSSYSPAAWPYDASNHLLPSTFGCAPLSGGTPGQVSGYDAAGNTLCSGQYGGSAQAFVWDAESRMTQLWGEQNNNTYGLQAVYRYDAQGNRIRSDQMVPGPTAGSYVTGTFREYSFFGGQMLAEKDQTGAWTDYVYANGKKIAKLAAAPVLHHWGDCGNCNGGASNFVLSDLSTNLSGYPLRPGDRLIFQQKQTNARAGLYLLATDGSNSMMTLFDQIGDTVNASSVADGNWHMRSVDLSVWAGKSISANLGVSVEANTPQGVNWDSQIADVALVSTDGSVQTLFNNQPMGGQAWDSTAGSNFGMLTVPDAAPGTHYYIGDHLGTTQMEFASDGWPVWKGEFAPFGQELDSGTTQNRYKFTGKERDIESGLDYFGARYYGSNMGRFMSPDPSNLGVDIYLPQTWNRYAYVVNNPLGLIDKNGLWPTQIHEQIIDKAFPGLTPGMRQGLKDASYNMDHKAGAQETWSAPEHAMSEGDWADDNHVQRTADFITNSENAAESAQAQWSDMGAGNISPVALLQFGNALHTISDGTSPSHEGGQPWDGIWH